MRRGSAFCDQEHIGPDQVANTIRGYWRKIVEMFSLSGFSEPERVSRFRISSSWHDTCRHYAGAKTDGTMLVVAPQIVDLEPSTIFALLAHEAGHFVDFGQPGRWFFRTPSAVRVREGAQISCVSEEFDSHNKGLFLFEQFPRRFKKHLSDWKNRNPDEVERVADAIAEFATGTKIGYTGPPHCLIQTIAGGIERPVGLR